MKVYIYYSEEDGFNIVVTKYYGEVAYSTENLEPYKLIETGELDNITEKFSIVYDNEGKWYGDISELQTSPDYGITTDVRDIVGKDIEYF